MKRFNSTKWIVKNKYNSSDLDKYIPLIAEYYIEKSLPKTILVENISIKYKLKVENELRKLYSKNPELLQEGLWSTIKNTFSKLGSLTKGGQWTGKKKLSSSAEAEIKNMMEKASNETIKNLKDKLEKEFPGFPNMKKNEDFIRATEAIAATYESVKKEVEEGKLEETAGNLLIAELRKYVLKIIDYDLASVYRTFTEETKYINEAEDDEKTNVLGKGEMGAQSATQEKVYKSYKLPLGLALSGLSAIGLHVLSNTDWFQDLLTSEAEEVSTITTNSLQSVQPGDGVTQVLNQTTGIGGVGELGPNSTVGDLTQVITNNGGGNLQQGLEGMTGMAGNQGGAVFDQGLKAVTEMDPNTTLADAFTGNLEGTGQNVGDMLVTKTGGQIATMVTKVIVTTIAKKAALAGAAMAVGKALLPIGISALAAGALVGIARLKGLKSSRMKTLQDVVDRMYDVKGPKTIIKKVIINPVPELDEDCVIKVGNTTIVISEITQLILRKDGIDVRFTDFDLKNNKYLTSESLIQFKGEEAIDNLKLIHKCLDKKEIKITTIEEYIEKREEIKKILIKYIPIIDIIEEEKEEKEKEKTKVVIEPPKDEDEILKGSRRNDQWAFILQKLNPPKGKNAEDSADLFALLAQDPETFNKLSSKDQKRLGPGGSQEIYDNALKVIIGNTKIERLKEICLLLLNLRKNPDFLLKKINALYPDDKKPLNIRAKSKSKFGKFTKGSTPAVSTAESLFKEMALNENKALWDKLIGDDVIKQNVDWLIPAAASIWGGEGSTNDEVLALINKDNVEPEVLDKIKKSFPTTGKAGEKYKFLPDVDRLRKKIEKNPMNIEKAFSVINTNQKFDEFVLAVINRFDEKYITKSEVPGILTTIASKLELKEVEKTTKQQPDVVRISKILDLPAISSALDKINNKVEFIQTLTFFIEKIEGIDNSIKKSRLTSIANTLRKQQQTPDFKDKVKQKPTDSSTTTTAGDDFEPVYTVTKESFKSLAEQLGYINPKK